MDSERRQTRRGWLCAITAAAGGLAGCSTPRAGDTRTSTTATGDGATSTNGSDETSETAAGDSRSSDGSSWPTFRGDNGNTGCEPNGRGPLNRPDEKWTVSTDGGVWSSPVVGDGLLYVGCMDGTLYAIDVATGDVDWRYETNGPVQSTPTVVDDRVYFGSLDKHVYCLDAKTGEEQWSYETAGLVHSSPTISGTMLYIGSGALPIEEIYAFLESSGLEQEGGGVYALNRETGALEWRAFSDRLVSSTPAVVDGSVYAGLVDGEDERPLVVSLEASDGSVQWDHETDTAVLTSPSVWSNTVYCASYSGNVYALSTETGDEEWTFHVGSGEIRGSTAVCDGSVYVPVSGNALARNSDNPVLYSLSLDGDEQWSHEIAGGRQMGSSPAVTSDAVYVGTHYIDGGGGLYAVSPDGKRLWGEEVSDGEGVGSSPAVVDGTVYYGADDNTVNAIE